MLVVLEAAKVAVSVVEFGTVAGVQLAAVFQSMLIGSRFQVALPARPVWMNSTMFSQLICGSGAKRAIVFLWLDMI